MIGRIQAESEKSDNLFLYIDLPKFDFPVVFSEPVSLVRSLLHVLKLTRRLVQEYPLPVLSSLTHSSLVGPSLTPSNVTGTTTPSTLNPSSSTSAAQAQAEANLFSIVDPEIVRKNPVEAKHRRLVRDHRNGPLDRELKPNAKIRDELNVRYYLFHPRFEISPNLLSLSRTSCAIHLQQTSQHPNEISSGNSDSTSHGTNEP